jgi:hypothetical protein
MARRNWFEPSAWKFTICRLPTGWLSYFDDLASMFLNPSARMLSTIGRTFAANRSALGRATAHAGTDLPWGGGNG